MDYEAKPSSRENLRRMAAYVRLLFDVPQEGEFPVLEALEKVPDIFSGSCYQIVDDDQLPVRVPACCYENDKGGFTIEIKETVYRGAYEDRIGAYIGFICHEICHVFLFTVGYKPIYSRSLETGEIPAFRSVEWQAKALCAEVMIPYEESRGMKKKEIIAKYHVSKAFAEKRRKLEEEKNG